MDYQYLAYTKEKKLVKGLISAPNESTAMGLLNYGGYQIVRIKPNRRLFSFKPLNFEFSRVDKSELISFSRQMALLIESGVGVIRGLELLQSQARSASFKRALTDVISDIQGGSSLSSAMAKHSKYFSAMYRHSIAAGEQGGNLNEVLNQMADFLERSVEAEKKMKGALSYPAIVSVIGLIVIVVLVNVVFPAYAKLFTEFGGKMPFLASVMIASSNWSAKYGLYVLLFAVLAIIIGIWYFKTEEGSYRFDKFSLKIPVFGHINLLNQLAYSCRTMALLFRIGLRPNDVIALAIEGNTNRVIKQSLKEVQEEMLRGEGLAKPMSKRPVFLSMMVKMVAVGEETGNLPKAFTTVARSFETDSDERTKAAIGLIQPAVTVLMGAFVVLVAMALVQAMYGVFGQLNLQ